MSGIEGLLFGPNLPESGVKAKVRWQADVLLVDDGQHEHRGVGLRTRAGGFNATQLRIDWTDGGSEFSLLLSDETAKFELLREAPAVHVRALERALGAPRQAKRRFVALWLVLGCLAVALPILAVLGVARASSKLANLVPREQEAILGRAVLEQTRLSERLHEQGPLVDTLRNVGSRLVTDSAYEYHWYVAEDPQLNAFAAPGGFVVVTTGLLDAAGSAEELAGVLAHEVAHTERRHATAGLLSSLGLRTLFGLLLAGSHPDAGGVFASFTQLKFSRDAEREADRDGLARLRRASIECAGMLRMFEKLAAQNASRAIGTPDFLSTHPDIVERIEWLRRSLHESPAETAVPLNVDWGALRRELDQLKTTRRSGADL